MFPTVVHHSDPYDFLLEGTRAVLVEFPGWWLNRDDGTALVLDAAERLIAAGLVPVIAHPERSLGLRRDRAIARALVEQGCLLCMNGDSAFGANGSVAETIFSELIDDGLVSLVASDGHRSQRPPRLDGVYRLPVERYGQATVTPLFDGSTLPRTGPESQVLTPAATGR